MHILRPQLKLEQAITSSQLLSKVGGLMGFGSSVCTTTISFDRIHYYPGEKCTVKIVCDNTKCDKAVKSFKLKLKRKVYAAGERVTA